MRSSLCVMDAEHYVVRVPPELADIGVLIEPLSIVEKAIAEALQLQLARLPDAPAHLAWLSNRRCLVAGLGPVGLLGALLLRLRGATVYGLDIVDFARREKALDRRAVDRFWPMVRQAETLLDALEAFANASGFLPQQIWDQPDIPSRELFFGRPAGSAMPLVWAHAEYSSSDVPCVRGASSTGLRRRCNATSSIARHPRSPSGALTTSAARCRTGARCALKP